MTLTKSEKEEIKFILKDCLRNEHVRAMKNYVQHGQISTYEHCKTVTKLSFYLNKRLHLHANEKDLVTGAFLHDFYLYDWHDSSVKLPRLHGYFHPEAALKNAKMHFDVNKNVEKIIATHMWPLTLTKVPTSREAVIVCLADKYVSTIETLACRKRKVKIIN